MYIGLAQACNQHGLFVRILHTHSDNAAGTQNTASEEGPGDRRGHISPFRAHTKQSLVKSTYGFPWNLPWFLLFGSFYSAQELLLRPTLPPGAGPEPTVAETKTSWLFGQWLAWYSLCLVTSKWRRRRLAIAKLWQLFSPKMNWLQLFWMSLERRHFKSQTLTFSIESVRLPRNVFKKHEQNNRVRSDWNSHLYRLASALMKQQFLWQKESPGWVAKV